MNIVFDPEKHFLGKLCRHGHEWENTSKSLRYQKGGRKCVFCTQNSSKNWHLKNLEADRAHRKKYRELNSEHISQQKKEYHSRPEVRKRRLEVNRNYERRNKEKRIDIQRRYRENHSKRHKEYYKANRERVLKKTRAYCQTPQGKFVRQRIQAKRRAHLAGNHSYPYSQDEVMARFDYKCAYCQASNNLSLDHFIPISKGGPDCLSNVIPSCQSCNSSKGKSDPLNWFKSQAFYDKKRWLYILKVLGKKSGSYLQLPLF